MISTKHQHIRSDLKAKIARGFYLPGQALPSQNQLMSEYAVAQGTVRQALVRLQADGVVVSQRGKGTFVRHPKGPEAMAQRAASIGLIVVSSASHDLIVDDQLPVLQQAAAKLNYELGIRVFDISEQDAAAQWASRHTGIVLWGAAPCAFVECLLQHQVPMVVIGELLDGDCPAGVSWIRYDLEALIGTALQLMVGAGHRHLWFINRESSAYFRTLSRLFAQQAAELGLDASARELVLERPEDEPLLITHLAAADPQPTALLIEGDMRACRFIHLLQQADWPVPQRIGVVALGAAEAHRLGVPDLYRVINSAATGVNRAAEVLAEMIDTGHVVRHIIAPKLSIGRTCGPITPAGDTPVGV
ncbi:MAG: GntR family transcriptional regulator [Phycisphaeraceae bacterium]